MKDKEITPKYHEQVYQPEADTYLLLKAVMAEIKYDDRVIEIGTGSGKIAGEAYKIAKSVTGTDINPHACRSAAALGPEIIRTDLSAGISSEFDLVIFNPPYLPTEEEEKIDDWLEYALDGGISGRETIEKFAEVLPEIMNKNGRCLLLVSSLTGTEEVRNIFSGKKLLSYVILSEICEDETLYILRIVHDVCGNP
ncbi:HemK2/MTQ2 family protein methyltransferase [Methanoplanus endosymbiosus]|uniref:Methyltransferase n=1 Tax=Methanoplanus endosymbiosus TaxID=33865 RepID=A0A9E7PPN0_9EURY|nr:HemK2/MTQ2 family protein methyltransferase [Methanoplanus endosymbiosus]UUX92754.1 methyltransferase [Methanoplanus endosymbiosus]